MAKHILLLNGPNLNLLGTREPSVYGSETLADVETRLVASADAMGAQITCIQSNAEHEMVDAVHQAKLLQVDFVLINPGAFTHTVLPCEMPCWAWRSRSSRCTYLTSMLGRSSVITRI